jgi:hypothetical protein
MTTIEIYGQLIVALHPWSRHPRSQLQSLLCYLRDKAAEETGETSQEVQDSAESEATTYWLKARYQEQGLSLASTLPPDAS